MNVKKGRAKKEGFKRKKGERAGRKVKQGKTNRSDMKM
jgi:hypothetical protein